MNLFVKDNTIFFRIVKIVSWYKIDTHRLLNSFNKGDTIGMKSQKNRLENMFIFFKVQAFD